MNSTSRSTLVLVLAVVLVAPTMAAAHSGWVAGLAFGPSSFDVDELDELLVGRGFTGLESTEFGTGFTAHKLINGKVIVGLEVVGSEQVVFSDAAKATVNVRSSQLNLGYVVVDTRDIRIFPMLGIGNSGVDVRITDRAITPTFAEVVDRSFRDNRMQASGLTLNFAVGADYFLRFNKNHGRGGLLFGTRLGYAFSPSDPSWEMGGETEILGGPNVDSSGPYVRFVVGGGCLAD